MMRKYKFMFNLKAKIKDQNEIETQVQMNHIITYQIKK